MSDTLHHRKPGTPRRPSKRYIPQGRQTSHLRNRRYDEDTFPSFEPTHLRRTR